MFIAALFTIAKVWKQPKCPSIDEWIEEMWYTNTHTPTHTHTGIPLSHFFKKRNIVICNNMGESRRYYA